MGHIHIMEDSLSNKIAAGEVVERPTSVVKELVENAVDAGSTSIEIILEEAGLTSIQVIDNGHGMDTEDALVSFMRHATSKIDNEHDLFRIKTLGFRGEALASIASVSKVKLMTSNGETGVEVYLEGGKVIEEKPAPLRKGTDIKVSQLFFNTPARLKYMKTIQTEIGHTIDLINRLALCYPNISFTLRHHDHELLHTNGRGDLQQVLAAIYGIANAKKMIPFNGESADYKIYGYTTIPEVTRASKNYMSIFVNGRWVKHYTIQKAIIESYHTFLPIGRAPISVIHIEGDPHLTDVNVHPAKQQIRLSKEGELMKLIETTLHQAIRVKMQAPEVEQKKKKFAQTTEQTNFWKNIDYASTKIEQYGDKPRAAQQEEKLISPVVKETIQNDEAESFTEAENWEDIVERDFTPIHDPIQEVEQPMDEEGHYKEPFPDLEIIGQIHGTYIVAQSTDGFYLVDQHAAQERIKYEFFKEKVGEVSADERQALLLPLTFHYSADEALTLIEHREQLVEVGVFLEEFGQNSFVIREYPTWFPPGMEQEIIEDLIEQVLTESKASIKKLREAAAIMMSCKKSIKANHFLDQPQMVRLLDDLKLCDNPFTCPHGRPVIIHFRTYEIEKMFKRVM
ncbi:DNA mismatch repair protein MutL [Kurthia zopfii]|uniref:DNA mismatch repair protein MutL n=1 Tax=Kurthia zopfii TaxID=1650 RepID=A0A8B4Q5L6_9BACL|nr:DNA mismatch repair endonuclease MutL [Kurthia zopfii]PWI22811.1 DNA mismatch repair endonuclease MutL [Kurthia zopfii]TDR41851.1 DNA mismatch repair protein MutL [Kurthia zopfii]GEK31321.1 DNA mismatch repair protein MutL [Kurthia zopfii]STX09162.1 DNA mismatch repair protein mutL [Kurthia zopfii]